MRARDWATWMARTPPKAFHHQWAMPSVCGRAWQISARGAVTIRMVVRATRTTKVRSRATRTPMTTSHIRIRKMLSLPAVKELRTKSRRAGPAVSALTPPPIAAIHLEIPPVPRHVHAHRWRHTFAHEWKRAGGDSGDLMLLRGWTSDDMPRYHGAGAAAERAQETHVRMGIGENV
jgi:hypothetical protein